MFESCRGHQVRLQFSAVSGRLPYSASLLSGQCVVGASLVSGGADCFTMAFRAASSSRFATSSKTSRRKLQFRSGVWFAEGKTSSSGWWSARNLASSSDTIAGTGTVRAWWSFTDDVSPRGASAEYARETRKHHDAVPSLIEVIGQLPEFVMRSTPSECRAVAADCLRKCQLPTPGPRRGEPTPKVAGRRCQQSASPARPRLTSGSFTIPKNP
jgi:hypothetical protein